MKPIIKAIIKYIDEERSGLPISIADIRKQVLCDKTLFDKIIIGLSKSDKYFLTTHFSPLTMSKEEKESAIFDGKDSYFIYVTKR